MTEPATMAEDLQATFAEEACMVKGSEGKPVVAFVFPHAAGHVNPSLALARRLVARGCSVEYAGSPAFKGAIEDAGAAFTNLNDVYGTGDDDIRIKLTEEGLPVSFEMAVQIWHGPYHMLQTLPGIEAFLKRVRAAVVVYCPLVCGRVAIACQALKLPCVSLGTCPGPGYMRHVLSDDPSGEFERMKILVERWRGISWIMEALEELRTKYGRPELTVATELPIDIDEMSPDLNLVTTIEELGDAVHDWHQEIFDRRGIKFQWVGPLLDIPGAMRAGSKPQAGADPRSPRAAIVGDDSDAESQALVRHRTRSDLCSSLPMDILQAAKAKNRKVIFVSMGTVVTADLAWHNKTCSCLTGKELCQSVYRAVFELFGDEGATDESAATAGSRDSYLIVVAVGTDREEDALEGFEAPGNAICRSFVPQLEVLATKPMFFITHGGQNSCMESLNAGVPMVVCPGLADQPRNAAKVEKFGFGLMAAPPPPGSEKDAAAFQMEVKETIEKLMQNYDSHRAAVDEIAERLSRLDGVTAASDAVLEVGGIKL